MRARNQNKEQDYLVISMADSDSEVTGACKTKLDIFDSNKPEGKRTLNLRNTYDRIILQ